MEKWSVHFAGLKWHLGYVGARIREILSVQNAGINATKKAIESLRKRRSVMVVQKIGERH